jgi:succinate dehydrogenase/fumarate reductase flavoprotein subunit
MEPDAPTCDGRRRTQGGHSPVKRKPPHCGGQDSLAERAAHRIALLQTEIAEFYTHFHVSRDLLELRNLVQVAELIVRSAQGRHESRGLKPA